MGRQCIPCRLFPFAKRLEDEDSLDYAREHYSWTQTDWEKVIFSDESRFLLHRSDGRVYVRRMSREQFKEMCIQTTVKHGGAGVVY